MKTKKQLDFIFDLTKKQKAHHKIFGGSLLKNGHARMQRPLSSKDFTHIVLKSDIAVKNEKADLRMSKKRTEIENIIRKNIQTFGIRIHKLAIASNHIHLLVSFKSRHKYFHWIRSVTGLIARLMLGAERGLSTVVNADISPVNISAHAQNPYRKINFWSQRPFTRIVLWGRDFKNVYNYVEKNLLEAVGFISYIPRGYVKIFSG